MTLKKIAISLISTYHSSVVLNVTTRSIKTTKIPSAQHTALIKNSAYNSMIYIIMLFRIVLINKSTARISKYWKCPWYKAENRFNNIAKNSSELENTIELLKFIP